MRFGSSLPPVVCTKAHVLFTLVLSNTYCIAFLFCFLFLVYPMLPVSLECPLYCTFWIAPSVFSAYYILLGKKKVIGSISEQNSSSKVHNNIKDRYGKIYIFYIIKYDFRL